MAIVSGDLVEVTTASGERVLMRALSGVMAGRDFEVVWVAMPEEWERAAREGDEPDGLPWPSDALRIAESSSS